MSKILLIDDDRQINEVVKTTLELLGHNVCTAESADDAHRQFEQFAPDVTLVDYAMPGRTGVDLLRELGEHRPQAMRFLATGLADFALLKEAVEAGALSMLCKPYHVSDLVSLIETAALLNGAIRSEQDSTSSADGALRMEFRADDSITGSALADLIAFAKAAGSDEDVAYRRVPVIACELIRNAATHGSRGTNARFTVELSDRGEDIELVVRNSGPAFDWQKALARAQAGISKARASGLQLVVALAGDLSYEDDGRTARARIRKRIAESPA